MKTIYDWDEIKQRGDCVRFVREVLGIEVGTDSRCAAVWRGGTRENSVSLTATEWFDFADNKGGSIIDLCAVSKFNGDIFSAAEFLGQWLGLQAKQKVKEQREIVATYDYADANGQLVIQVVRYRPKDFRQRRPDPAKPGEWLWSVEGIIPPLYRLSELRPAKFVFIAAGEKDVDNIRSLGDLAATCNAGGEGKWKDDYNAEFAGKTVAIIADKDDTGRAHAQSVAYAIRDIAKSVRIMELPDRDKPVKDASDWIEQGGTRAELIQLVRDTPVLAPDMIAPPKPQKEISAAKLANSKPFSNYVWVEGTDDRGNPKPIKQPRKILEMQKDLQTRFWGFPHRLGELCFDHDRTTGLIRFIRSSEELMAWISEKSNFQPDWARKVEGAATTGEFFATVRSNARAYNMISAVPNWPVRQDVYYTHGVMPEPSKNAEAFEGLLKFFSPATKVDALLLRALFASPLYFRQNVPRPLWVIDSEHGQGVGKTKLIEMLAMLYGGSNETASPIYVDHKEINSETQYDRVMRRLLSETARQKRILLLDNIDCTFQSAALSRLTTASFISGMAPYGRGEETRPMDLTICLTANSANMHRDIIHRSLFIHLSKPENPLQDWVKQVSGYIEKNRLQILSDIIAILEKGPQFKSIAVTRNRDWEQEVMFPMLGSLENHSIVAKQNTQRSELSDSTIEDADAVRSVFAAKMKALGIDPESERTAVWIPTRVQQKWCRDSLPGFGGSQGKESSMNIRGMVKNGTLNWLSDKFHTFPHHGPNRCRGLMWNQQAYDNPDLNCETFILGFDAAGEVIKVDYAMSELGL